jgi:nucleotide-binding universal stress UspA family protein
VHRLHDAAPQTVHQQGTEAMSAAIVCGINWSRRSWGALRLADALATRCDLRLKVLHVAPPATESVQRDRGERLHDGIRNILDRADVPVTIGTGAPVERLVDASRRAAVLVIGSAGTGSLRQALRGNVSASLTRRSACPVIVAPSRPDRESRTALAGTTILCAVRDERDLACAATAACWARDLGMSLTLARVIEPPPMQPGVAIAAPPPVVPLTPRERAAAAADSLMRLATEISAVAPDDVRTRVAFGAAGRQLRKLAESEGASMIVVGSRRHGALREALSRSPTARLLRRGPHPVMVCPRADAALLARRSGMNTSALKT